VYPTNFNCKPDNLLFRLCHDSCSSVSPNVPDFLVKNVPILLFICSLNDMSKQCILSTSSLFHVYFFRMRVCGKDKSDGLDILLVLWKAHDAQEKWHQTSILKNLVFSWYLSSSCSQGSQCDHASSRLRAMLCARDSSVLAVSNMIESELDPNYIWNDWRRVSEFDHFDMSINKILIDFWYT